MMAKSAKVMNPRGQYSWPPPQVAMTQKKMAVKEVMLKMAVTTSMRGGKGKKQPMRMMTGIMIPWHLMLPHGQLK
jgi:hypothetical protein